jgi:hypothetical protein
VEIWTLKMYMKVEKGSAESGKRNKRWLGSEYDENTL